MIKELALLTQIQAEQINNIELAIDGARDYVAEGETKLVGAKNYYKKSQKVFLFHKLENVLHYDDSFCHRCCNHRPGPHY
jgi:hypothetical protein